MTSTAGSTGSWRAAPQGEPGRKLHKRMLANRAHLFVFVTNRSVPYTNNVSERHLRPSVIFRKVTNGFRCEWGAETYAAFRSVVSTAKANRASVLDTVRFVLSTKRPGGDAGPGRGEQYRSTMAHSEPDLATCSIRATNHLSNLRWRLDLPRLWTVPPTGAPTEYQTFHPKMRPLICAGSGAWRCRRSNT